MRLAVFFVIPFLLSAVGVAQKPAPQQPTGHAACSTPTSSGGATTPPGCPANVEPASSTAAQFPYPGDVHAAAGDSAAPPRQTPDNAKQFPYPGDTGRSSSSSSSSSSNSPGDDSTPDAPGSRDAARQGSVRRRLPKPQRLQSDEDREAEDLTVAKFYRQSGDLQAAYLRAKDAVRMQPNDAEAHFALADIAQRMNKRQEAVTEYSAYLGIEPDGDQAKVARKALAGLR